MKPMQFIAQDAAAIVASIRSLRQQGVSVVDIATRLRLDQSTVLQVLNGTTAATLTNAARS